MSKDSLARPDTWLALRQHTNARIALGRSGTSLPTREILAFTQAHAQARDAIHTPLDVGALQAQLQSEWPEVLAVNSQAASRAEYLLRPDRGRRLHRESLARLKALSGTSPDLVLVVGDGLSPTGIQRHAAALLTAIRPRLLTMPRPASRTGPLALGPLVLASQARVALADEVGEALGAAMVAMLIGERPGLSSPDSVGIYLTLAPKVGCHDAQRNCISNIRPEGQDFETAAHRFAWLVREAFAMGQTGVGLKDRSDLERLSAPGVASAALPTG